MPADCLVHLFGRVLKAISAEKALEEHRINGFPLLLEEAALRPFGEKTEFHEGKIGVKVGYFLSRGTVKEDLAIGLQPAY